MHGILPTVLARVLGQKLIAGTAPEKGGPRDCLKYDITTLLPPFQGEEVRFGHFV